MIRLVFAAVTVATLALLLVPLLRRQAGAGRRLSYDAAVYRDQLAEVTRDLDRGILSPEQAEDAKAEVQRRILAAAEVDEPAAASEKSLETGRRLRLVFAMLILVLVPGGSLFLYARLGAPELPAQPFAGRQNSPEFRMAAMIETLQARLERTPDAEGYLVLAGSLRQMGRLNEAAESYRKAISLGASNADAYASLGETIAMAAQGDVGPEARAAFLQALGLDRENPSARFYLGLSEAQAGRPAEGIAIWRDLLNGSPADAPWRPMVEKTIAKLAAEAKLDPGAIPPKAPSLDDLPRN